MMWLSPFDYHCVILDGALPGLKELWYAHSKYIDSTEYLYAKTPYASMLKVSPLIGKTSFDDPFLPKLYEALSSKKISWDNWGCLLNASASPDELAAHFRRWITIYDDIGEEVFFRFYDPDILPHFAAALDGDERQIFFGPVKAFMYRQKEKDVLGASVANRPQNYDLEPVLQKFPQKSPCFSLQNKHIKAMRPIFLIFLVEEVAISLLPKIGSWVSALGSKQLREKVVECLDVCTTINNDTLPEKEEAVIFCSLAFTSCSHFYESPEFLDAVQRNGFAETLDEWRRYAHDPIPGLEAWHDPLWLEARSINK